LVDWKAARRTADTTNCFILALEISLLIHRLKYLGLCLTPNRARRREISHGCDPLAQYGGFSGKISGKRITVKSRLGDGPGHDAHGIFVCEWAAS
jgi:hypothetical protein